MAKNIVDTTPDQAALDTWAMQIEREIAEITSAMLPLQKQLEAAKERLDLVRRLRHLSNPAQQQSTLPSPITSTTKQATMPEIEDHIEETLRSAGSPMHIRDIRAALIRSGIPLPGRGDEANIILRIRRARDRFVRTGRGTYALLSWNIPVFSPSPKKRKIRKRKVSV